MGDEGIKAIADSIESNDSNDSIDFFVSDDSDDSIDLFDSIVLKNSLTQLDLSME